MKIPRDLKGRDLVKILKPYGYEITRQSGSHIRVTTQTNGQHHLTIPDHDPLKIGTLAAIMSEVSAHLEKTKEELMKELFG